MNENRSPSKNLTEKSTDRNPAPADEVQAASCSPVGETLTDTKARDRAAVGPTLPAGPLAQVPDEIELEVVQPRHYEIGEELARGGMGRVLRARDRRHGRQVAIKEMLRSDRSAALRFQREALITARLQHPSIVPVYEAGTWPDGSPFYVMKLVEGTPLRDLIERADSLAERLALLPNVLAVTEALAYAHSREVIHRDLTPSNVIVGEFGQTVVIDWGLAKLLDEDDGPEEPEPCHAADRGELTVMGAVFGTPAYMAPEQSEGKPVDRRSDVYSLGAILYQLLAGEAPYSGDSGDEILGQVRSGPPVPLDEKVAKLPLDLVAIVNKAMARDPDRRYQSAKELTDELRRFHTGQLVGAHRYTPIELIGRWLRKHRAAVAVAASLLAILAVGAVISVRSIMHERDLARRARAEAIAARTLAENQRGAAENMVDYMLEDLGDRLRTTSRLDMLEGVTDQVKRYYDEVGKRDDDDFLKRRERMLLLLGEVLETKGDIDGAKGAWRSAAEASKRMAERYPRELAHSLRHAEARRQMAWAMTREGREKEAMDEYRATIEMLDKIAERHPEEEHVEHAKVDTLFKLGEAHFVVNDVENAMAATMKARAIARKWAAKHPEDPKWQKQRAIIELRYGDLLRDTGRVDEALELYDDILPLAKAAKAADPQNKEFRYGYAYVLFKRSLAESRSGMKEEARAGFERAAAELDELKKLDPADAQIRFLQATALGNAADTLVKTDPDTAADRYRQVLALLEPIVTAKASREWQLALADTYLDLVPASGPDACKLVAKARAVAKRIDQKDGAEHGELMKRLEQTAATLDRSRCQ